MSRFQVSQFLNPNNRGLFSMGSLPKQRQSLLRDSFSYQNPYRGDEMTGSFQNVGNAVTSRFGGGTIANPTYPNASILNQNAKVQKNNFSALGSNRPNTYIDPNNRLATPIASSGSNRPNTYIDPNKRLPNPLLPSNRQPGIPTANNRTAKPNMMNSLLNYASSPSGRGMARGILEASGYSTMPKSLGEVIARGMEYSQQNVNTDLANKLAQRELDIKEQEAKAVAGSTSKDTASIKNFKFYDGLSKDEKKVWDKLENQSPELAYLMALQKKAGEQGLGEGEKPLTPMQEAFDKTSATELANFMSKEYQGQITNLKKFDDVINQLENNPNLTGAVEGAMPFALKVILNPASVGVEDDIESIIFQSLKATLGAQFTEAEGRKLVKASFNKFLPEEVNIIRLKRLRDETQLGIDNKVAMFQHMQNGGSLRDWKGGSFGSESMTLDKKITNKNAKKLTQMIFSVEDYAGLDSDQLLNMYNSDISEDEKTFIYNNLQALGISE